MIASVQPHFLGRLAMAALALAPAVLAQNETATTTTTTPTPTPTLPPADPVFNPGVGNYTLVGCYAEPAGARALTSIVLDANQTVATCVGYAQAAGATFAGLEYARSAGTAAACMAARPAVPWPSAASPALATRASSAVPETVCFSYYSLGGVVPPVDSDAPAQPPTIGNYTFNGCVTEGNGTRALSELAFVSDAMTLQDCATFCDAYKYFGVEYSRECYCGNAFNNGSVPVPAAECSMVCSGNGLQFCGAGNRLSSYGKS
ncbi:hypothetical protein MAPG_04086 [Magnaporthiopsis poae ATCC 64411]|uniref:WSC domain-containing protein n=1 Tax=Magnaporthiopsis poae (strain ATCC 64411 / 73-15) TaxID=644358 RepID=A0A0C4DVS5_MAGP6|nr:hypothetical protein MAPG_04086 [Magnaporthiopsis poae ATCC 64411]